MSLEDEIDSLLDQIDRFDNMPLDDHLFSLIDELASKLLDSYQTSQGYILEHKGYRLSKLLSNMTDTMRYYTKLRRKGY